MQLNLDSGKLITGILSTLLIGASTFLWTVNNRVTVLEQGKDLSERVEKIENALLPVLVEYKVDQELKKRGIKTEAVPPPPPLTPLTPISPSDYPYLPDPSNTYNSNNQGFDKAIRDEAENWAKEQIPNVAQQQPMK